MFKLCVRTRDPNYKPWTIPETLPVALMDGGSFAESETNSDIHVLFGGKQR